MACKAEVQAPERDCTRHCGGRASCMRMIVGAWPFQPGLIGVGGVSTGCVTFDDADEGTFPIAVRLACGKYANWKFQLSRWVCQGKERTRSSTFSTGIGGARRAPVCSPSRSGDGIVCSISRAVVIRFDDHPVELFAGAS